MTATLEDWDADDIRDWMPADVHFENLSEEDLIGGARIQWSSPGKRTVTAFCAKHQVSRRNRASGEQVLELVDKLSSRPLQNCQAFDKAAEKLLSFIDRTVVGGAIQALAESKFTAEKYECVWYAFSEKWFLDPNWDGNTSGPPRTDISAWEARPIVPQRHTLGNRRIINEAIRIRREKLAQLPSQKQREMAQVPKPQPITMARAMQFECPPPTTPYLVQPAPAENDPMTRTSGHATRSINWPLPGQNSVQHVEIYSSPVPEPAEAEALVVSPYAISSISSTASDQDTPPIHWPPSDQDPVQQGTIHASSVLEPAEAEVVIINPCTITSISSMTPDGLLKQFRPSPSPGFLDFAPPSKSTCVPTKAWPSTERLTLPAGMQTVKHTRPLFTGSTYASLCRLVAESKQRQNADAVEGQTARASDSIDFQAKQSLGNPVTVQSLKDVDEFGNDRAHSEQVGRVDKIAKKREEIVSAAEVRERIAACKRMIQNRQGMMRRSMGTKIDG